MAAVWLPTLALAALRKIIMPKKIVQFCYVTDLTIFGVCLQELLALAVPGTLAEPAVTAIQLSRAL